ncbi:hypothetical protein MKQ70_15555 [Chitinophaga sedimenti]|uniref:hypothetical protein n=1 Tax=Chitinophaga sedimenti TaxID=2033606 RepID=UPI0020049254|nr:hypothetical protein [Chitinophaga sedimenti]MCK7556352.1 hypothetical protein [Chitinophaga sedimenti]
MITEPGSQNIVAPLLQPLGIQTSDSVITEESRDYAPDFILARFADSAGTIAPRLSGYKADKGVVSMVGTSAISFKDTAGFHTVPLLVSKNNQAPGGGGAT